MSIFELILLEITRDLTWVERKLYAKSTIVTLNWHKLRFMDSFDLFSADRSNNHRHLSV